VSLVFGTTVMIGDKSVKIIGSDNDDTECNLIIVEE
jgi:hypothetical protein